MISNQFQNIVSNKVFLAMLGLMISYWLYENYMFSKILYLFEFSKMTLNDSKIISKALLQFCVRWHISRSNLIKFYFSEKNNHFNWVQMTLNSLESNLNSIKLGYNDFKQNLKRHFYVALTLLRLMISQWKWLNKIYFFVNKLIS